MKKLLSVFLLALLASCGQKSVNIDDDKKAIVNSWNDWEEKGKAWYIHPFIGQTMSF